MSDEQIHRMDHPVSRPSSACQLCRARHETQANLGPGPYSRRCPGSGHIVYTLTIRSRSPYWVATTTCLVCNRQVRATRPTRACPWSLVGSHAGSQA